MKNHSMKYDLMFLWVVFLAALVALPASANGMGKGMDVDKKVSEMKQRLSLNDDQASQLKGILNDFQEKEKMLHKEKQDRINALLTPEQKTKHEQMMKEWKNKKKDKGDDQDEAKY